MPWDPVRDLLTMQGRLESLFGQATTGWVPPVDLIECEKRFVLTIELPGLDREDVSLDVLEQVLTVRGARPAQATPAAERFHQLERSQGAFSRAFRFSAPIDADAITADMHDGVLTVVVPKEAGTARRIELK